jgi:hypothetical protein
MRPILASGILQMTRTFAFKMLSFFLFSTLLLPGCNSTPVTQNNIKEPPSSERSNLVPEKPAQGPVVPRGHVIFSVQNGDLNNDILPYFVSQAGVFIAWRGAQKKVSLSLVEPLPWKVALDLLCRFNKLAYRQEEGRVVLFNKGDALAAKSLVNYSAKPTYQRGVKSSEGSSKYRSSRSSTKTANSKSSRSKTSTASKNRGGRAGLGSFDKAIYDRTARRQGK